MGVFFNLHLKHQQNMKISHSNFSLQMGQQHSLRIPDIIGNTSHNGNTLNFLTVDGRTKKCFDNLTKDCSDAFSNYAVQHVVSFIYVVKEVCQGQSYRHPPFICCAYTHVTHSLLPNHKT